MTRHPMLAGGSLLTATFSAGACSDETDTDGGTGGQTQTTTTTTSPTGQTGGTGGQGAQGVGGDGGEAQGGQGGGAAVSCAAAPVPTTCDAAHGTVGCCAGGVRYWYASGAVLSADCGATGCGWYTDGGQVLCSYDGPDPAHPNDLCCGGTNPYGGCG